MGLPNLSLVDLEYMLKRPNESRQPQLIILTSSLLAICYLVVGLRLISRRIQRMRLAWDDFVIILALASVTCMCGFIYNAIKLGLGRHVVFAGTIRAFHVAKMLYFVEVLFPLCNLFVKLSILLLYRAIFGDAAQRWFTISLNILIAAWIVSSAISTATLIFQCVPIQLAWTTNHALQCINLRLAITVLTAWTVVLSFFTLVLPMPILLRLKLSLRDKISIASLFALGGADVIVCILRAVETKEIDPNLADFTWLQSPSVVYGVLEPTIALICGCIPTLRPIFRKLHKPFAKGSNDADKNTSWKTSPTHKASNSHGKRHAFLAAPPKASQGNWTVPISRYLVGRRRAREMTTCSPCGLGLSYYEDDLHSLDQGPICGDKPPLLISITEEFYLSSNQVYPRDQPFQQEQAHKSSLSPIARPAPVARHSSLLHGDPFSSPEPEIATSSSTLNDQVIESREAEWDHDIPLRQHHHNIPDSPSDYNSINGRHSFGASSCIRSSSTTQNNSF